MGILHRLWAVWFAFNNPEVIAEGVSIQRIARQLELRRGMAILRYDPQADYIVEMLPPKEQRAIENYLGF